jgi:phasin family protein
LGTLFVQRTISLLQFAAAHYIVQCNIRLQEASMAKTTAKTLAKKTVATPAKAAAKSVKKAAPKAMKAVRAKAEAAAPAATKIADLIKSVQPKGMKTMTDTVKNVQENAKDVMEKGSKLVSEIVEFNKGNIEAVVEAGKIGVKGAQEMGQRTAEVGRKNWDATTAMVKQAAAVKSPTDLFKLQGDFARAQFDGAVAEMSKSTEMFVKLAGEMFQPLQNRYAVAAEKVKGFSL